MTTRFSKLRTGISALLLAAAACSPSYDREGRVVDSDLIRHPTFGTRYHLLVRSDSVVQEYVVLGDDEKLEDMSRSVTVGDSVGMMLSPSYILSGSSLFQMLIPEDVSVIEDGGPSSPYAGPE